MCQARRALSKVAVVDTSVLPRNRSLYVGIASWGRSVSNGRKQGGWATGGTMGRGLGALFHGVGYSSLKASASSIARTSALRPQHGSLRTRFTRSEKRARASPDSGPTLLCPGDAVADRYCKVPVMDQAEGVTASDTDMFATIATCKGMGGGGGGLGPNASSCKSVHRCGPRFTYRMHAHFPQSAHTLQPATSTKHVTRMCITTCQLQLAATPLAPSGPHATHYP